MKDKYRNFGRTGVKVSPLTLGCMNFGGRTEKKDALKVINKGVESGINIIDTGIMFDYDLEKTIDRTMEKGFAIDHYDKFLEDLGKSKTILYLSDNCGEIIFDKPVLEIFSKMGKEIWTAVKSAPILNDALYEDAVFAGLDEFSRIIETGSGFLGVNPDDSSEEFMHLLNTCDIIISKGQANFESLNEYRYYRGSLYFILKVKCDRVADVIKGSSYGDSVFIKAGKEY